MTDTICAISTPLGEGAIAIIRLSGNDAISLVSSIFTKDLTKVPSHTIHYGYIKYKNEIIDEVLVSVMKSPKTFTTEDVVEINTHGGIAITNKILEILLTIGARLAEPGEFTKRAFLNGRIDLVESEAVSDLITADTENARKMAINQVTGTLSKLITTEREKLAYLLSNIEVNIDYPEYEDVEVITHDTLLPKLKEVKENLSTILKESKTSKLIKDGLNICIVGRPNVGKSSLLNRFLNENKAIVTNIAGTTRDIVEGSVVLNGIKLNFIDTAGIRNTTDIVEKIGVDKSLNAIEKADLVILVLNSNEKLTKEDKELLDKIKNLTHIIFVNKNDLQTKLELKEIPSYIEGNTNDEDGIKKLKEEIINIFNLGKIESKNLAYMSNARQISLVEKSIVFIDNAINSLNEETPIDLAEIDIKNAWNALGEIIGATYTEELIDELFKNFCLGK